MESPIIQLSVLSIKVDFKIKFMGYSQGQRSSSTFWHI